MEIVKCLMRNPRLVVLDEPTAVLLPAEIEGLLAVCERIAAKGCSVVLVTHKLAEIKKVAHRATVLRGGRVVAQSAAPAQEIGATGAGHDPARPGRPGRRRRRDAGCGAGTAHRRPGPQAPQPPRPRGRPPTRRCRSTA